MKKKKKRWAVKVRSWGVWLPIQNILSRHFEKYMHGMVLKFSGHIRNTISLLYKQKTEWNSDVWNFFSEKNGFYFQFWSIFIENPLFESGHVRKRHWDVIREKFSWFWYQWKEETLLYTMVPNNHTLGPSISSSWGGGNHPLGKLRNYVKENLAVETYMYRPYWIVFWITNTKNHNVCGIEFKNARWLIELPARFMYNLMC